MRVNIYAEEMTERIAIISKTTEHGKFTGLRFYLELPVTQSVHDRDGTQVGVIQSKGPFMHHPDDDDSAAVTFWGKRDLRNVLRQALSQLDDYYDANEQVITE